MPIVFDQQSVASAAREADVSVLADFTGPFSCSAQYVAEGAVGAEEDDLAVSPRYRKKSKIEEYGTI